MRTNITTSLKLKPKNSRHLQHRFPHRCDALPADQLPALHVSLASDKIESLGPVGFARFIQQFEAGYGDYTKEKYLAPEPSMDELDQELQKYM